MGVPLRVLQVEQGEAGAAKVLRALAEGGLNVAARRVATPQELLRALEEASWDLVLAEYRLPGLDATGALHILLEAGLDLPFIIVADRVGEESAVAALRGGAWDFVHRDRLDLLVPAVERSLREARARLDRAQAEEALNTGNYRMKIILDSLMEGVVQFDRAGRVLAANARAARLLPEATLAALERASLREDGSPWPPGTHPATRALKAGEPCVALTMGIRAGAGATVWVSLSATPLLYRSREPWGVVVSFTDITERRQEERRQALVADLQAMAHQAPEAGTLALAMAERLAAWSECRAVAIRVQEGPEAQTYATPGFAKASAAHCPAVATLPLQLGENRQGTLLFLDPSPGRFQTLPLAEVAGMLANLLAKALTVLDLRRSEAMLAQAQALAGLGSWELQAGPQGARWSREHYRQWGCDPAAPPPPLETLLGKVHPQDREAFAAFHQTLAHAQAPLEVEYRITAPDGATRYLHSQALPQAVAPGGAPRIHGATLDITTRKLDELTMRDLEKLTARGQMAAYIAHEINNPLGGIRNAFLLLREAIPREHQYASYIPLIEREIDRIGSIIRTMYHLYRPEPSSSRKVVMAEVFQDLERLLTPKCRAQGVAVAFDPKGVRAQGAVNEGFLRQVLFNLIQNAVEASSPGGVVTVRALTRDGRLEITVADQGAGIPPELSERIFQSGFTTKVDSEMSGLGLGLATCRSLVETMGGTLAFEGRAPGPGTVFTVRLPFPEC